MTNYSVIITLMNTYPCYDRPFSQNVSQERLEVRYLMSVCPSDHILTTTFLNLALDTVKQNYSFLIPYM